MLLSRMAIFIAASACVPALADQSSNWPFLGGNRDSQQYFAGDQINSKNVDSLGVLWYSDLPIKEGLVGNPLVSDGVIYQSVPRGGALATDVATGKTLWTYGPPFDFTGYSVASMTVAHYTRGLGIDDKHVYLGAGCQLIALDRQTGSKVWETRACDPASDSGIAAEPRVGNGKVFVGVTNFEYGTNRGYAAAFDADSGKELWRFYTVPGDPNKPFENKQMEIASKTWGPHYWTSFRGAGGVWEGMIYDPKTDLLIFGAGNPGVPRDKPGMRVLADKQLLYSDSLIAVNASTGTYAWHFQYVQGDLWDFGDGAAHIVLADLPLGGQTRHVILQAAKDGFFYLFDAKTGKFISANNYVPVKNYEPMNPKTGKLTVREELRHPKPGAAPQIVEPDGWGAHTWELMSYNPKTGLAYIPAFIFPSYDYTTLGDNETPAKLPRHGRLVAWDPIAQKERWHVDDQSVINGGVLSTAGNLVLQGTPEGNFTAYDATTGQRLWYYDTHAIILGAPAAVTVNDKELILVPTGDGAGGLTVKYESDLATTPETTTAPSRLVAFALGGTVTIPNHAPKMLSKPVRPLQDVALAKRGEALYGSQGCGHCHSDDMNLGGASYIPDLRNTPEDMLQAMPQILRQGLLSSLGMPKFPELSDDDVAALQAFIINTAWSAYNAQNSQKQSGGRAAAP
jgi:PQQ-dependent dehydrogenase (methanol/ethanol family)